MLVVWQLPLADVRSFLTERANALSAPAWPDPEPGREFVRTFGAVQPRRRGGDHIWSGEAAYCDASNALRFPAGLSYIRLGPHTGHSSFSCQFRRLFVTGPAVARIEVGFALRAPTKTETESGERAPRRVKTSAGWRNQYRNPLAGAGCLEVLTSCLAMPVRVPLASKPQISGELIQAGQSLASLFLRATTAHVRQPDSTPAWYVTAGRPICFVEYLPGEVSALPALCRPVNVDSLSNIDLAHTKIWRHNYEAAVWFIGQTRQSEPGTMRKLRLNLGRLHAERESLRLVLRHLSQGRLKVVPGHEASDRLQMYLTKSFEIFGRRRRYGLEQSPILESAYGYDDIVHSDDQRSLLERLKEARRSVRAVVEQGTALGDRDKSTSSATYYIINSPGASVVDKRVQIGDVIAPITGVVGADNAIQNSFNAINDSSAQAAPLGSEMLQRLVMAVAIMCQQLAEDSATQAARAIEALMSDLTSSATSEADVKAADAKLRPIAEAAGQAGVAVIELLDLIPARLGGLDLNETTGRSLCQPCSCSYSLQKY